MDKMASSRKSHPSPHSSSVSKPSAAVERHYTRPNLENTILTALRNAGKNVDQLTVDDLASIDEFHTQEREATANLASLLNLQPNFHVLDVGAGIGGPSRYLASKFGCRVADSLAKRVKLDNLLNYRQDDATFDVVCGHNILQ
jgi:cyclopropane fatty-acyl-phospholipid synthase-like methyltransferase